MSLITKVFIRNNRIVQVGDRVKIVGENWIGPEDQDYKGSEFTIVENGAGIRFIDPVERTIKISGVMRHNGDFE